MTDSADFRTGAREGFLQEFECAVLRERNNNKRHETRGVALDCAVNKMRTYLEVVKIVSSVTLTNQAERVSEKVMRRMELKAYAARL